MPWAEVYAAFDALEEIERIDELVNEFRAVLGAVRPRMEADALNRDYGDVISRLRYNPDAPRLSQLPREALDEQVARIMKGTKWREVDPPVS